MRVTDLPKKVVKSPVEDTGRLCNTPQKSKAAHEREDGSGFRLVYFSQSRLDGRENSSHDSCDDFKASPCSFARVAVENGEKNGSNSDKTEAHPMKRFSIPVLDTTALAIIPKGTRNMLKGSRSTPDLSGDVARTPWEVHR